MLQEPDNVFLEELSCDVISTCFEGKKIHELDIRNKTGANIIGLKRSDGSYVINPPANTILSQNDKLFALGSARQISELKKLITEETNPPA